MTKVKNDNAPRRISELVAGQKVFDSSGFSLLKVTKGGVEELLELPIKSTGVAEFEEELSGKAPKPPVKKELVRKDSKEGKAMGLIHDRLMQVFDTTDETYIAALERHTSDFVWQICIFALDITWTKKDGSEAETFGERKEILQTNGITGSHVDQIYKDVRTLTRIEEEEADFLPGS
ncbi:MAG: hypothetical protein JXB42_01720 [Deltaproteobacteria bacterium]|nr:hypothetical protein [Deltaproteobacteria bacterium]